MTLSTALEVGIGLMLIYYVVGLMVNIIVEEIKKVLDVRANTLEDMLVELLESYDGQETGQAGYREAGGCQRLYGRLLHAYIAARACDTADQENVGLPQKPGTGSSGGR